MEVSEGIIGLLPLKEMRKTKRLNVGDSFEVYIKKVDSTSGKIHLTLSEEDSE